MTRRRPRAPRYLTFWGLGRGCASPTKRSPARRNLLRSSLDVMDVPAHDLRRQGSHLYGLVITGAVLATVNQEFRLARVAVVLLSTLVIYWAAETFVHWTTARTLLQRDLTAAERR